MAVGYEDLRQEAHSWCGVLEAFVSGQSTQEELVYFMEQWVRPQGLGEGNKEFFHRKLLAEEDSKDGSEQDLYERIKEIRRRLNP